MKLKTNKWHVRSTLDIFLQRLDWYVRQRKARRYLLLHPVVVIRDLWHSAKAAHERDRAIAETTSIEAKIRLFAEQAEKLSAGR